METLTWIIFGGLFLIISELLYYKFIKELSAKEVRMQWAMAKLFCIVISGFINSVLYIFFNLLKEILTVEDLFWGLLIIILVVILFYLNWLWAKKIKGIK